MTDPLTLFHRVARLLAASGGILVLASCSSGNGVAVTEMAINHQTLAPVSPTAPKDTASLTELSVRMLTSDGPNTGLDAYDLIREFGGPRPIEAPDLYSINHPGVDHIYEDTDAEVGDHFVFIIHRDKDMDRNRQDKSDRQRNEIKTYARSESAVKGFENETLVYRWKFKINADMTVSKRFSHFFQLKAVGGPDSHPIVTISGAKRRGEDGIEVRHSALQKSEVLDRVDWSAVTGEWLNAYCRATFSDTGAFRLIVTRSRDGATIFDIDIPSLDLWRGDRAEHFVRPKWGIYRSILDRDNLRIDEENVRFADFSVTKVRLDN